MIEVSAEVGAKAIELVEAGRVTLLSMSEARVRGASSTYQVRAHQGGGFTCECAALGARCSHIAAASLAWAQEIERLGGA